MWGESLFREAYAFVPQSTVGDINSLAMINFYRMREEKDGEELLLTTHDEIVVQCWERSVGKTVEKLRKAFEIPVVIKGREFKVPVDVKIGLNWEDLKEVKG
jgi:DNA polymerase I-like protein with 3'-5' exonuclease and polymerase domains